MLIESSGSLLVAVYMEKILKKKRIDLQLFLACTVFFFVFLVSCFAGLGVALCPRSL